LPTAARQVNGDPVPSNGSWVRVNEALAGSTGLMNTLELPTIFETTPDANDGVPCGDR